MSSQSPIILSMPSATNHSGDELDALNYELAGVVDVEKVLSTESGAGSLMQFYAIGHPKKAYKNPAFRNKSAPGMVVGIGHNTTGSQPLFAVFFATQDINPGVNRPLISSADLLEYRAVLSAVHLDPGWSDWESVVSHYQGLNATNQTPLSFGD